MRKSSKYLAVAGLTATLCSGALALPIIWVGDSDGTLGTVDVSTGGATVIGQMSQSMTDIAFDPTGNLWGITTGSLYQINKTTAATTLVGNYGAPALNSLIFGANGTLYAAGSSLYKLDTATGAAALIGNGGGYSSSGDLAFVGGNLYLSSFGDDLFMLNRTTGAGTKVGAIGYSAVYGLATDNNIDLYGLTGTNILDINATTGAGNVRVNYAGTALGAAWGSAFLSEAGGGGGSVPEPSTIALLGLGLAGLWVTRRRHTRSLDLAPKPEAA